MLIAVESQIRIAKIDKCYNVRMKLRCPTEPLSRLAPYAKHFFVPRVFIRLRNSFLKNTPEVGDIT